MCCLALWQCLSAKVPAGIGWLETYCHINAQPGRERGVAGAHEIPSDQCSGRRSNLLLDDNGMVDRRRRDGETGMFDWGFALTVGAILVTFGLEPAYSQTGLKYGAPAGLYFIFDSLALLAAAGDVRMLVRAVFLEHNVSCVIFGACALRCFSPQGLSS